MKPLYECINVGDIVQVHLFSIRGKLICRVKEITLDGFIIPDNEVYVIEFTKNEESAKKIESAIKDSKFLFKYCRFYTSN